MMSFRLWDLTKIDTHLEKPREHPTELIGAVMQSVPAHGIRTSSFTFLNNAVTHPWVITISSHGPREFLHAEIFSTKSDLSKREKKAVKVFGKSVLSTPLTIMDLLIPVFMFVLMEAIFLPCSSKVSSAILGPHTVSQFPFVDNCFELLSYPRFIIWINNNLFNRDSGVYTECDVYDETVSQRSLISSPHASKRHSHMQ